MTIYRLAASGFKDDLRGEGAMLYGGRWNSIGNAMVYGAQHISLAVLEILVNKRNIEHFQTSFHLIQLRFPEQSVKIISTEVLKKNWHLDIEYTRFIGDHFLQDPTQWILKVPSAVIPEEFNYIMNPIHADFKQLEVLSSEIYPIDKRLSI